MHTPAPVPHDEPRPPINLRHALLGGLWLLFFSAAVVLGIQSMNQAGPGAGPGQPGPGKSGTGGGTEHGSGTHVAFQTGPEVDLGDEDRFLSHLSTDKPIYRPGEPLYLRSVLLHALTHKPVAARPQAQVKVTGPKGDTVFETWCQSQESVAGMKWDIPSDQAGGEYKISLSWPQQGYPPAERKFDIRSFRAPRLRSQLEFVRKGYGPGDTVAASLSVQRAEGGVPSGAMVTAVARVDGQEVYRGQTQVDSAGRAGVSFALPARIARGEGTLALVIQDGGVVETAAKTIPILLQTLDVAIYPEGGDLVASLTCGVYVEARTPWGDPADIHARILDEAGTAVAELTTAHEGRGRTEFIPSIGSTYELAITEPAGIREHIPLPKVRAKGVSLRALPAEAVVRGLLGQFAFAATEAGTYRVALYARDKEVASLSVNLARGEETRFDLAVPANVSGVLRATVYDSAGKPRAERLVFRRGSKALQIAVTSDPARSVPGGDVNLTVRTTDEQGRPVSAVVGLSVTDDAVLELVEKRLQAPRLPVMALLEPEVEHLEDAWIYLSEDPKAELAADLLLGTQGWRRFAYVDAQAFLAKHEGAGLRALAQTVPPPPPEPEMEMARGGGWLQALGAKGDRAVEAAERAAPAGAMRPDAVPMALEAVDKGMVELDLAAPGEAGPEAPPAGEPVGQLVAGAPMQPPMDADFAGEPMPPAEFQDARARRAFRPNAPPRQDQVQVVRVYAHTVRPDRKPADRSDFTQTLYWCAGLKTDETGTARVSFGLSDAVTTFRVRADGYDAGGRLGASDAVVESVEPMYVEPKLPLEVTSGDKLIVPMSVVNGTRERLQVRLECGAGDGLTASGAAQTLDLAADGRGRLYAPVTVTDHNGRASIVFAATAGTYSDRVRRELQVSPRGFPVHEQFSGMLAGKATHTITIPASVRPKSLTTSVKVYPTPLASLTEALEALLREPNGCFEQTSSTNYPLIMAQQYFTTHLGVDPALIARANQLLDSGYKKLTGFESPQKGYEWFGGDPGHEALTAYGVLEFMDMSKVYAVDADMLARTRDWLLSRRTGQGGFQRNSRALDSFGGAPDDVTNAYIVWSLTEADQTGLSTELDALQALARESRDPYIVALAAGSLFNAGRKDAAVELARKLGGLQAADGSLPGASTSITRSGGEALTIETTSLAVLAWLKEPAFAMHVEKAMRWLTEQCKGGRFGSTQSTVLALKAIVAYDASRAAPKADGQVELYVNGDLYDSAVFTAQTQGAIELPKFADLLAAGQHTIELRMKGGASMPYSVDVGYFADNPASSDQCAVELSARLSRDTIREGETAEVNVVLRNRTDKGQPMTVAVVGLPGGLEPRHEQLKELVKAGTIDFYEVRGREVVVYQRDMAPNAEVSFRIDAVAAVPGEYTGPASRAYLYYTDEYKCWVEGISVRIEPR